MSEENVVAIGTEASNDLQQVNMLDLANIDLTNVEEFRFSNRQAGLYDWEIKKAEIVQVEAKGIARAAVVFELEVLNCLTLVDKNADPAEQIGEQHRETFFIIDPKKSIGQVVAFIHDIGHLGQGPLTAVLNDVQGLRFRAAIRQTKDKNDTSKVYSNLDRNTVQILETDGGTGEEAQVSVYGGTGEEPTPAFAGMGN